MVLQSVLGLVFQSITATWSGSRRRGSATIGSRWWSQSPLVIAPLMARRGSVQGLLSWFGLIGYGVYNYAYYLFGAALNAFFLLYVVAFVLSAVTLILVLAHLDVTHIAASFRPTTPVRIIGGYLTFVGFGLASVWLSMWAAYVFTGDRRLSSPRLSSWSLRSTSR